MLPSVRLVGPQSAAGKPALVGQGPGFFGRAARPAGVALFILRPAEPRRPRQAPEPAQEIITLFHSPVILLHVVVELATRALRHLASQHLANGPGVGVML